MASHQIRQSPVCRLQSSEVEVVGCVSQSKTVTEIVPSADDVPILTGHVDCLILIQPAGCTALAPRKLSTGSTTSFDSMGMFGAEYTQFDPIRL